MRQFPNHATRQGKEEGALDFTALSRQWEAQARGAEAGALQGLARRLWRSSAETAQRSEPQSTEPGGVVSEGSERAQPEVAARALTPAEEREVMARALAQVQERKTVW